MDRQRDLVQVLEHDRDRFTSLGPRLQAELVDASYRAASDLLATTIPDTEDADATVALLLGSLVALRRTAWTFGRPPLGVDDKRALDLWVDLAIAWVQGRHSATTDVPSRSRSDIRRELPGGKC